MKRERGTRLLLEMVARLCAATEPPLSMVDEVHVFGSYARGALEPHDVDLIVEFTPDEDFFFQMALDLGARIDPYAEFRSALAGRSRSLQFQFRELERLQREGFEPKLLWRRGESIAMATARLEAITPDPAAGRAERDAMLPAFEGIDRWVPRQVRELIVPWVEAGAVAVEQVELPDAVVAESVAARAVARRWGETSPRRRAATNALAYLERMGIRPEAVHLDGRDILDADTPYFVGFEWRHARGIHRCLTHYGGEVWLEVPHPVRGRPLIGVRIDVRDRALLAGLRGAPR